jgi:hypothetical protein
MIPDPSFRTGTNWDAGVEPADAVNETEGATTSSFGK